MVNQVWTYGWSLSEHPRPWGKSSSWSNMIGAWVTDIIEHHTSPELPLAWLFHMWKKETPVSFKIPFFFDILSYIPMPNPNWYKRKWGHKETYCEVISITQVKKSSGLDQVAVVKIFRFWVFNAVECLLVMSERLKKGQNDLKSRGVNLGNQWALNKENGTTRGEIVLEGKRMNSL